MYLFGLHFIVVVSWIVFLLQFIKSIENQTKDRYLFLFISVFFMFFVLYFGTKLILLNPSVAKNGVWLHLKLSFDILLMLYNIYLVYIVLKRKNVSTVFLEISYWIVYFIFMFMIYLSMFKPF